MDDDIIMKTNYENSLNILQQTIKKISDQITKYTIDFTIIHELTTKLLQHLELDIYLPKATLNKKQLLQRAIKIFTAYFNNQPLNINEVITFLELVSQDNIKQHYDYGWLYEEKHDYFKPLVQGLLEQLFSLLTRESQKFTADIIAKLILASSVWEFKPSNDNLELMIKAMESALQNEKMVSPNTAFNFLKGLTRFHIWKNGNDHLTSNNPTRAKFIAALAETALPLLLQDEPPLQFFNANTLALFRITSIYMVIPQPDLGKLPNFHALFNLLFDSYGSFGNEEIYDALPESMVPYKSLLLALEQRQADLHEAIPDKSAQYHQSVYVKEEGKTYSGLDNYQEIIKRVNQTQNPRGIQWLLTCFSRNILREMDSYHTTYFLSDIKDFLKTLRHCLTDARDPIIQQAITRLGKEVLTDSHFKNIDAELAIELLWINMVFSTTLNDSKIAYSTEEKTKLFNIIGNFSVNSEEHARALFAIKTLGWHGQGVFSANLIKQIKTHQKNFINGSNPSLTETKYYNEIKTWLQKEQENFLKASFICDQTGQEIDIAYLDGKKKIAIHIDGPAHFNPVTGQSTLQTLFRNICLKKAGWVSFNINLIDEQILNDQLSKLKSELIKVNTKTESTSISQTSSTKSSASSAFFKPSIINQSDKSNKQENTQRFTMQG